MSPSIKRALAASVPLVIVETSDAAQTVASIIKQLNGKIDTCPVMQHDLARGLRGLNDPCAAYFAAAFKGQDPQTLKVAEALIMMGEYAASIEQKVFALFQNPQMYWSGERGQTIVQAIWNLRDTFKLSGSIFFMLVPPGTDIPNEIKSDSIVMKEPLPTAETIKPIVENVARTAKVLEQVKDIDRVIDTLLGYPNEFIVEQVASMSLSKKDGYDMRALWDLRVSMLKSMAGLEISLPSVTYANLAGCYGAKAFLNKYLHGRRPPRIVFWLDEIEKMIGGASNDGSNVSQALLEQFLFWTEQQKVDALLLTGIPGAGKSATAQCTAGEAGVPLARGSMSIAKGQYVGQSEAQWSRLLDAVAAIGQGRVLMLATCNNIGRLPPEVLSRFKLGTFFYDFPTDEESAAIWQLYIKQYELKDKPPVVKQWVGREIESCCHRAWLFNDPLSEAMKTVVPVSLSRAAEMAAFRQQANGCYNSAAYEGVFSIEMTQRQAAPAKRERKVEVEE
jgi:hypothetical protein